MPNSEMQLNLISQNSLVDLFRIDPKHKRSLMIMPSPLDATHYVIALKGESGLSYMSGAFARSNKLREFKSFNAVIQAIKRLDLDVPSVIFVLKPSEIDDLKTE